MDIKLTDKVLRRVIVLGAGAVLGCCAISLYRYWRKKQIRSLDEGFEDVSRIEDNNDRKILLLGLPSAGKTTIAAQINTGSVSSSKEVLPTEGIIVTTLESKGVSLNIWEVGGKMRSFWHKFIQDTDILVFVVDAADIHSLALAVREMKWLLAEERLENVPVLVLANKQDLPNAMTPEAVADALDLGSVPPTKHKIRVLGTQAPPSASQRHPSMLEVEKVLMLMLND